jgi:membrane protease YdiL (CAAX protease family)
MTGWDDDLHNKPALLDDKPARGHPVIAWIVILTIMGGVAWLQMRNSPKQTDGEEEGHWQLVDRQLKINVGVGDQMPTIKLDFYKQARQLLESAPFPQRLRIVPLAGELDSAQEALARLEELRTADETEKLSQEDRRLMALLGRLYKGYKDGKFSGLLDRDEQEELLAGLGWFGELALAPARGDPAIREAAIGPARRGALAFYGGILGGCGLAVLGFVLLIVQLIRMSHGPWRRGFKPGSQHGGLYAETFAVWLILFTGMQVSSLFVPASSRFFVLLLGSFLSLTALFWPVFRGIPWAEVRQDVGLTLGKGPIQEILSGVLCYVMALPLLFVGLLIMQALLLALRTRNAPSHPIFEQLGKADNWLLFQLFLAACVLAPLIEEVFFRGVLYRHLREATNGMGYGLSFVSSALIGGFLFAVVHPQGLLGVPILMSLAFGLSIAREWRGSLLSCMILHGINNGLVMLLALSTMGS